MILDFSQQLQYFLWSVVIGVALCFIYDFLKVFRILSRAGKATIFVCDFLFMAVMTFATVFLSIGYSRGATRYYAVLGEFCGFMFTRFTFGRLLFPIFLRISVWWVSISKKTYEFIAKTAKKLLQHLLSIMYNVIRRIRSHRDFCSSSKISKKGKRHHEAKSA